MPHSSLIPLCIGFLIDLWLGDPHGFPHPVIAIGHLITFLENFLRKVFPKTKGGEQMAGGILWILTVSISTLIPWILLYVLHKIHPLLSLFAESILCWQILATKSLSVEAMHVYDALKTKTLDEARFAVSMIVGRDTKKLNAIGVTKAAIETVAENTSDGIIAPLLFMAIGGAPLGMFYKAINTMDSMLGYVEMPYKHIGLIPAKMDDLANFLPSRFSALMMLLAGKLQHLDTAHGWKIFCRDRFKHASPNSAQTEAMCAGLLGIQLAGDAWYHGVLHKKEFIGDPIRPVNYEDIPATCRLSYGTAVLSLCICILLHILF